MFPVGRTPYLPVRELLKRLRRPSSLQTPWVRFSKKRSFYVVGRSFTFPKSQPTFVLPQPESNLRNHDWQISPKPTSEKLAARKDLLTGALRQIANAN
jgi:hypothetical protein